MPFDENGNYTRLYGRNGWQNDRDADIKILASRHDEDDNDKADALSETFLADGRKTAQGPFKMGGYKLKSVGDAVDPQDAPTAKQVQAMAFHYGLDVSEEADALKVNLSPTPQALPKAVVVFVKVAHTNTGKTTLQLNSLAAKPVYLGEQELDGGMLKAGGVYIFFYNNDLDAWQLIPSGATAGTAVPPFTMIILDHLLSAEAAVGWELQGTRCYKSKYWDQYQQLADEYAEAVERSENVEGTDFVYKLNLDTMRRFYTKNDYDARFELCGDSGGYVLDEETYSFWLPKSNNYMRPAVDADNLAAYQTDTMRPITGAHLNRGSDNGTGSSGAFYDGGWTTTGRPYHYDATTFIHFDSARLGTHYAGSETAPKSRFVAVYYKLGTAYTEPVSQAALAAQQAATDSAALKEQVEALAQLAVQIAAAPEDTPVDISILNQGE